MSRWIRRHGITALLLVAIVVLAALDVEITYKAFRYAHRGLVG